MHAAAARGGPVMRKLTLVLLLWSVPVCAETPAAACEGEFYWEGQSKVCLGRPVPEWIGLAAREPPGPDVLADVQQRIRTGGLRVLQAERPFRKYGLLLLPRPDRGGALDARELVDAASSSAGAFEVVNVYRQNRALLALVNSFTVSFRPKAGRTAAVRLLESYGARIDEESDEGLFEPGDFVIRFPGMTALEALRRSNQLQREALVRYCQPNFEAFMPGPAPARQRSSAIDLVWRRAEAAERNPAGMPTGRDPLFPQQWYLKNEGQPVGLPGADINAIGAWSRTTGTDSVVIAILDVGVETQHVEFQGKIVKPYDATDQDDVQDPQSIAPHGTQSAGLAAAIAGNKAGIEGVGAAVKLMPVRIATVAIDPAQPSDELSWNTSAWVIARGIRMAVNNGANVLSCGCYWHGPKKTITAAIDYALKKNRVLVFAAGNYSTEVYDEPDSVAFPASLASQKKRPVIAVSATNEWDEFVTPTSKDGEKSWGSRYGPAVTVSAPGVHMVTTDLLGDRGDMAGSDYSPGFEGTSAATPLVAGVAALVLSVNPGLTPAQVKERLESSAKDLGKPGWDDEYGWGRVDACRAVRGISRTASTSECN